MHHDSDGGQCYSAHRGIGDGVGSDGTRRGQCYSTRRIVGYCHGQVWLLAAAAYFWSRQYSRRL